ncbi:MAG: hypothetical protein AAF658_21595, partial [Myxococcota bacterium]
MRNRHAPERGAWRIEFTKSGALSICDTKIRQVDTRCRFSGAIDIESCETIETYRQDFNHTPVWRAHPAAFCPGVVAKWYALTYREIEEILDVEGNRGIKRNTFSSSCYRLVDAELDSV